MSSGTVLKGIAVFTAVCGAIGAAYAVWEQIFASEKPIEIVVVQPQHDVSTDKSRDPVGTNSQNSNAFQSLRLQTHDKINRILSSAIASDICGLQAASLSSYDEGPGGGVGQMNATLISASIEFVADETWSLRVTGNGMGATQDAAKQQAREDFLSTLNSELHAMTDRCAEGKR